MFFDLLGLICPIVLQSKLIFKTLPYFLERAPLSNEHPPPPPPLDNKYLIERPLE